MIRAVVSIVASLLLAGCSNRAADEGTSPPEERPAAPETTTAAAEGPAQAPAAAGTAPAGDAEPTEEEIPVAEDYEEAAETEITADNYRAHLDRLAAEIEGDSE